MKVLHLLFVAIFAIVFVNINCAEARSRHHSSSSDSSLFRIFSGSSHNKFSYQCVFPKEYFVSVNCNASFQLADYDYRYIHSEYSPFEEIWKGSDVSESVSAADRRKASLAAGSGIISYGFLSGNCKTNEVTSPYLWATQTDGVSNVLYNVSYIMSAPAKLIHGTRAMIEDNFKLTRFLLMVLQIVFFSLFACLMIIPSAIAGTFFYPEETLQNLSDIGGTLTDLFYGAVIRPLADIVLLFF